MVHGLLEPCGVGRLCRPTIGSQAVLKKASAAATSDGAVQN